jgi:hypothetical protein
VLSSVECNGLKDIVSIIEYSWENVRSTTVREVGTIQATGYPGTQE